MGSTKKLKKNKLAIVINMQNKFKNKLTTK